MTRYIPDSESLTTEFKSDLKKYPDGDIFDAVVALANTEGGDLYLGVEDDGRITGVHKDHGNPLTLSAFIANNTIPPLSVRAEIINEEKPVLKISVPKVQTGVVATSSGKVLRRRLKADGTPERVPMYPSELATRLSDLRLLDYSALPLSEGTMDDLDPLEIEHVRKAILSYDGEKSLLTLDTEELLKALGFVREREGITRPTVAGILMVGKISSIRRFVPTHQSAFQVMEGTRISINDDFVLPILASVEKLSTYLSAWNKENELEIGMFRMPAPDFDKRALREAIVNAYSHRDYSKLGRVRVALSDDGLTVANPGGFIEGITVRNLLTAEPHGRNPLLADALKRIGLAERTGRGIDRIYEGALIYGRQLPDYSASTSVMVSLFIPRSAPDIQMSKLIADEQNRIGHALPVNTLLVLNALKDNPRSGITLISDMIDLPQAVVKNILERSVETNLVEAFGSGRGRTYMLSATVYGTQMPKTGYVLQKDIDYSRHLELIISLAQNNDFIAKADVVNLLHVTDARAYYLIKKLVNEGVLEKVQGGHYAKYRFCGIKSLF